MEYHFSTVLLAFVYPPLVILFLDALWGNTSQLHSLVQYLQNIYNKSTEIECYVRAEQRVVDDKDTFD